MCVVLLGGRYVPALATRFVDHTHGAARVFTYFYVSGREGRPGARFKVVCANDRGGGRHRVKINPRFSQVKCAKVMRKFVAYCIANFWRE